MKPNEQKRLMACAVEAAQAAGQLMRDNLRLAKKIDSASQHDIKLELDVRCQRRIEQILLRGLPQSAVLGEEGVAGEMSAPTRWVVDPIDGTVNFAYGIPHSCVSIALQTTQHSKFTRQNSDHQPDSAYQTLLGVVYDPFCGELWTAVRGQAARLNGRVIHVSSRRRLREAVITIGFSKHPHILRQMTHVFSRLAPRVRKVRIMGAAALDLVYVASGRFDAYLEASVRLWDIAAGGLILECAGGDFWHEQVASEHTYRVLANNGLLRKQLQRYE